MIHDRCPRPLKVVALGIIFNASEERRERPVLHRDAHDREVDGVEHVGEQDSEPLIGPVPSGMTDRSATTRRYSARRIRSDRRGAASMPLELRRGKELRQRRIIDAVVLQIADHVAARERPV